MSSTIDERVVEMQFNNRQFESGVKETLGSLDKLKKGLDLNGAAKSLNELDAAGKNFSLAGITEGVSTIASKFTALGILGVTVLQNIANSAINAGKTLIKSLTIDPIMTGLKEYETQINAIQTILANTESKGTTLGQVNKALDELNLYADKTIYNFTEMTRNIGTFTAAGVELDTAVDAIKGIANLAAVSGSTSQQAAVAMYQLSQAISSGTVKLMDWNSVVNAGMGGQVFQDALKETARVHGIKIDEMIKKEGSFRNTLQEGWLTATILTDTLSKFTGDLTDVQLKAMGYTDKQVEQILRLGEMANDAATKVKTFSQLFDTLKEAATSGWAQSWRIIIGDFEEAKSTLTEFSDILNEVIGRSAEARNNLLEGGLSSGWDHILSLGIAHEEDFITILKTVAAEHGKTMDTMIKKSGSFNETLKDGTIAFNVDDLIKKYGSFEASLKSGWVTADLLKEAIYELNIITYDLSDATLQSMGMTREDADALMKLNEQVQAGTIDLEKYAKQLTMMSGRENIIQSIKNSFEAINSVLQPIKDAFRDIFPATTTEQLYNFTVLLKDFTEKLKIGDETAQNLKRTFKGVFAIFDIAGQLFSAVARGAGRLIEALLPAGKGLLGFTGDIGDWLVSLDETIRKSDIFNKAVTKIGDFVALAAEKVRTAIGVIIDWFEALKTNPTIIAIGDFLEPIVEKIKLGVEAIINWFKSFGEIDTSGIEDFFGKLKVRFEPITKLFEGLKKVFDWIWGLVKQLAPIVASIATVVAEAFGRLQTRIAEAIGEANFDSLLDLLNTGLLSGILIGIKGFIDSLSGISEKAGGFLDSVKGILDGVRETLQAYQDSLKAKTLLTIAAAIGVLALSLIALSLVDSDKLTTSLGAITVLFIELFGSTGIMSNLTKGSNMKNIAKLSTLMITMSISLLLLASSVKKLSELDPEELTKGLVAVGALIAMMTASAKVLSGGGSQALIKGATGFVIFAGAIAILGAVLKTFADMKWEELAKGGAAIAGMTALLVGAAILMSKHAKSFIGTSVAMVIFSSALAILGGVVRSFAEMEWEELAKGGVALAGMMVILVGAALLLSNHAKSFIGTSVAMVIFASALAIMSGVIKSFAEMEWEEMARGGVALAGVIALLVGAAILLSKFGGSFILSAISMVIFSGALAILAVVLKSFAEMSWEEIGKAFVVLAGSLLLVAGAMLLMIPALPGAAALLVVAAAMLIFVPVMAAFGAMSWEEIGKSMLMLAGIFVIFGLAGLLLGPLVPVLLGLGAAVLILGVGMAAVGAGMMLFALGLTMLAAAGTAGAAALVIVVTAIIGLLPMIGEQLALAVVAFAGIIAQGAPAIGEAIKAVLLTGLEVFVSVIPELLAAIGLFFTGFLELLVSLTPQLVDAGMSMILSILQGIAAQISDVVQAGIDVILGFIDGIAQKIPDIIQSAYDLIIAFINGLADGIRNNTGPLLDACENLVTAIVDGIFSFVDKAITVGEDLISGFIEGIKNMATKVWEAAVKVVKDAIQGVKDFLKIKSPSRVLEGMGENTGQGFVNGLLNMAKLISNTSKDLGAAAVGGIQTAYDYINEMVTADLQPTITPVVDMTNVEKERQKMKDIFNSTGSFKFSTTNDRAHAISVGTQKVHTDNDTDDKNTSKDPSVSFVQNNYSPKPLSRIDIYRQTRNQLSALKGRVSPA